jgi:demethylmenaquinone methyltransferase/2-methoxy-6-polyprenyl-1,4-benzoquinol methylase
MNRLMTMGQDVRWRREVIRRTALAPNGILLDLGAGTGDLACEALRQYPACYAVAADFTLEMMRAGRNSNCSTYGGTTRFVWTAADAHKLPFPDCTFDAIVSGFLLRNLTNIKVSLGEQYRVLKPGGRIICLDTSPYSETLLAPVIGFHLHRIIPTLGRLITGQVDAYKYLPNTTTNFLKPEQLAARLQKAGFRQIGFVRLMLSTIAIHWGRKPQEQEVER